MKVEIPTKSSIKKMIESIVRKEMTKVEKRLARLDNAVFYGERK